jgi:hypothetical protein
VTSQGILLLEPLRRLTHRRGIGLVLLEAVRVHEVVKLAVRVEILHGHVHDVRTLEALAGLEGALPDPPGLQVAQAHAIEGLALARLYELVLEDAARLAVEHDLEARAEFIGGVVGHRLFAPDAQRRG